MEFQNGRFEIRQIENDTFIEIYPPVDGGQAVMITEITEKLKELGIEDYDLIQVLEEIENLVECKKYKIKGEQENRNQSGEDPVVNKVKEKCYSLNVSDDRMQLSISFFPVKHELNDVETIQEIKEEITRMKIMAFLEEDVLVSALEKLQYNCYSVIANGKPVVPSREPYIKYHFQSIKNYRPEVDSEGNVNYHKLNVISSVVKNQVLATLEPYYEGESGADIYGVEIKPQKFKTIKLKRGKNVGLNATQNELYAEVDGLVKLEEDKVVVYNVLEINSVGNETGDIDFLGSVLIDGNIITGFKVIAKGDVEVTGVVEGAIIEAGGNVLLHRGIQGMNKSKITAGGNVLARYIENTEIIAGGIVHSEAILHSNVSARGEIKVEGKKGMITGGTVRSGTEITANVLGSHMGTSTNLEVGIDPLVWEEYNGLLKELPKTKFEVEKLDQVINLLNKKKEVDGELDEAKKAMYLSATRNKIILTNNVNIAERRVEELKEEVSQRNNGSIKVRGSVYPGVRVTIGNAKYFVRDELKYVHMIKDGADVKLTSL